MMYEIKLVSKDNNSLLFNTDSDSEEKAVSSAYEVINKNGWSHYNYKVINISKRIKNGQ